MNNRSLDDAPNPLLGLSFVALKRAALRAREVAIRTNTDLIIVVDGKLVRVSPTECAAELAQSECGLPSTRRGAPKAEDEA